MNLIKMLLREYPTPWELKANGKSKGELGEYLIKFALGHHNLKGYGISSSNIYIPHKLQENKTTEIDVLLLHEKGIFVVESKNYSGLIYGNETDLHWTQFFSKKTKNGFYNPIRQNHTHCESLSEFLDIDSRTITSYVVFSAHCELKNVPESTDLCRILKQDDLLSDIRAILKDRPTIYTKVQIKEFHRRLSSCRNVSTEVKKHHIQNINENCLFCGGKLLERNGKNGKFYGCEHFPACRFTKQIIAES